VSEPDPSLEEEREAAALRVALEEGRGEEHLPGDALETASFLRFGGSDGELSEARSARLRGELLASLPAREHGPRRPRIMIWLAALGGVGALTALLLTVKQAPEATHASATLPAPAVAQPALADHAMAAQGLRGAEAADEDPSAETRRDRLALALDDAPRAASTGGSSAEQSALGRVGASAAGRRGRAPGGAAARGAAAGAPPPVALAVAPAAERAPSAAAPAAKAKAGNAAGAAPARTRQQLEAARDRQQRELLARVDDKAFDRRLEQSESRAKGDPAQLASTREQLLAALSDARMSRLDDADKRSLEQDLYCRLAELALRQGQPGQALEWARQGIALDGAPSAFLGLLWQTQAEALEALGDKEAAARSYLRAQSIASELLSGALEQ
jgi:hypothetical protein